jgi:plastocyanin
MRASGPAALALVLALGLVATACAEEQVAGGGGGGGGGGQEEGGTATIAGQEATSHGSEDVTGTDEVELELDDFYFEPTVLEGEAGQTLTVSMFNEGDAAHTFTIDELQIDEELQPGDEGVTAEVTFPDSGALVFYCRFHVGGGMLGGLSVGGDLNAASGASGGGSGDGDTDSGSSGSGGGGGGGGGGYPGY